MDERALRMDERALWVEGLRGHKDVSLCRAGWFAPTVFMCCTGLCMDERALRDI